VAAETDAPNNDNRQEPPMNKRVIALAGAALIAGAALSGCGNNNFRDVKGVKSERPDLIRNFNNMDKHPNIGMLCIEGVAFATTTRDYGDAIERVPEWDDQCPDR
jgi:hypothetical protein